MERLLSYQGRLSLSPAYVAPEATGPGCQDDVETEDTTPRRKKKNKNNFRVLLFAPVGLESLLLDQEGKRLLPKLEPGLQPRVFFFLFRNPLSGQKISA